jgi:hypothetical protein
MVDAPTLIFCISVLNLLVTGTLVALERGKVRKEQGLRLLAEARYDRLHKMCNQFRRKV